MMWLKDDALLKVSQQENRFMNTRNQNFPGEKIEGEVG
jgi:hypothetical protein